METIPSLARNFFDSFMEIPPENRFTWLEALIQKKDAPEEGRFLDFKGGRSFKESDAELKKLWSKAISAFANTSGGVIIWGVDARVEKGIDKLGSLDLVPNPAGLKTKLDSLMREATDPPVVGILVEAVPGPNDEGFVVCFIPESPMKPHRAEFSGHYYYLRTGSHSGPMDTGTLRHMFYPHMRHMVVLTFKPRNENDHIVIECRMGNQGNRTLKYLLITSPAKINGINANQGWSRTPRIPSGL